MTKTIIQVVGDPTVDWLNPSQDVDPGTGPYFYTPDQKPPEARISSQAGGAALLTEFLNVLLPKELADVRGIKLDPECLSDPSFDGVTRAWTNWKRQPGPKDHSAFRISDWGRTEHKTRQYKCAVSDEKADLIIIDDSGLGFKENEDCWPNALTSDNPGLCPDGVLLKLSQYQNRGPQPVLDSLVKNGLAARTTVVTALSDLRACAVRIGMSLSWERLYEEIVDAVYSPACPFVDKENPGKLRVMQVIVTVNASGAVIVGSHGNTLIFDRSGQEGDFERQFTGEMMGYNTAVLGALAAGWLHHPNKMDWRASTLNGVALARALIYGGYEVLDKRLVFPSERLRKALRRSGQQRKNAGPGDIWNLGIFIDKRTRRLNERSNDWTILKKVLRGSRETEAELRAEVQKCAEEIVTKGPVKAKLAASVPVETVGNWRSADRHEIEGVRSVNNAMRDYLSLKNPETPLAIAVFGPPGAGKSFAIKEIAKGLGIGKEAQLTFNLSQFESPDELTGAFHQIRDLHLKGKMPLVFWDEFDTSCQGKPLGWLRYFLAPIQDGLCVDRGVVHPIGGGIFVFAGGTCKSFKEFCESGGTDDRTAKKPDFASRLRAYIDIKGPNGDPNSIEDALFMIRRAILLNSFLERHAGHLKKDGEFKVDDGVLTAFLRTVIYRHGARSMETIVRMSNLKGKGAYELSSLPPEHLLSMHVNAKDFLALADSSYREVLRIGVTGHMELDPLRMQELMVGIKQAVALIEQQYPNRTLTVFSPLAKGADRLVAREIRQRPDARLIAVLPAEAEDYLDNIGLSDQHQTELERIDLKQELRYLLGHDVVETIVVSPSATRYEAYEKVGFYIAEHCDVMIAVWDGQESQGRGGTGDVVKKAIELKKPIVHIWAGNHKKNGAEPTDVGDKHGTIRHCLGHGSYGSGDVKWKNGGI